MNSRALWIHRSRTRARERGRVTADLMEISAADGYGRRRSAESRAEQRMAWPGPPAAPLPVRLALFAVRASAPGTVRARSQVQAEQADDGVNE